MKKRILALFLVLVMLTLTSCTTLVGLSSDRQFLQNALVADQELDLSKDPLYDFDERIGAQIEDRFEILDEILEKNSLFRYFNFLELYNQQMGDIFYLSDQANLAFITYCMDTSKEKAFEDYQNLSELYTDHSTRMIRMYRTIHESIFGFLFFSSMDGAEVDELLTLSDSYSDEIVELIKERDDYVQEYQTLTYAQYDNEYLEQSAELYEKIVKCNNQIAVAAGYENYADYAYEMVYARDYSTDDAKELHKMVKEHIVPLSNTLNSRLTRMTADPFKTSQVGEKIEMLRSPASLSSVSTSTKMDQYYDHLDSFGGSREKLAYQQWKDEAFVCSVYDDYKTHNTYQAAFTTALRYYNKPVCYHGYGYNNLSTYIHEQGHYAAFFKTPSGYESLDLCEVHSQGNEWLFYSYMDNEILFDDIYDYTISYILFEQTIYFVLSAACDSFEQYVYEHPELTAKDYDDVFDRCVEELGATKLLEENLSMDPSDYWHQAIVGNSMYYISYAVSLVPSIELFVLSKDNYEDAAKTYFALSEYEYDVGFAKALEGAGLSSPFDEEVYVKIKEYFA
ncbi:MAG: hypothetical protein IJX08_08160 [Clostridia bacterium]|nr:hypothetical protein [Clostridia bacterium]